MPLSRLATIIAGLAIAVPVTVGSAFARPGYRIEWEPAEAHPGPGSGTGFTIGAYRISAEGTVISRSWNAAGT